MPEVKSTGSIEADDFQEIAPDENQTSTKGEYEAENGKGKVVKEEHVELEHREREDGKEDSIEGENAGEERGVAEQTEFRADEQVEGEEAIGKLAVDEHTEGEQTEGEDEGNVLEGGEESVSKDQLREGEIIEEAPYEVVEDEEEVYVEEPPPDPAAPFNFSDSLELLKEPFELRSNQLEEIEQLWEMFQNYNPAYTDINGYITEKELVYMLKSLLLMTYTPEQLQELIEFCVRPPHPEGHITYAQFIRIVTIRQRDFPIEEELRSALQVLDPEKLGTIDRQYFRDVLSKIGDKMPPKVLEHLIKEVDISNDGTIGIEDVIGTMCIDLNRDDIIMLRQTLFPDEARSEKDIEDD